MLKYTKTVNAVNSNRSGNTANGPRPEAKNPNGKDTKGLEVMSFKRKMPAKITRPKENSDFVLL